MFEGWRRYRVDTPEQLGGKRDFVYFTDTGKWWENRDQEAPTRPQRQVKLDASQNFRDRRNPEGHRLVHERCQRGHHPLARLLLQILRGTRPQPSLGLQTLLQTRHPPSIHPHAFSHRRGVETIPTILILDTNPLRGPNPGICGPGGVPPPRPHYLVFQ